MELEGSLPWSHEPVTYSCPEPYQSIYIYDMIYTGYTQNNGAVSKLNKKFISHLTRAQRTPSVAATVPSFSCATSSSLLMLTAGPVSKMASQQEKAFCVLRFEVSRSVITVQREFRARFRKDAWCVFSPQNLHTSKQSTQKAFSCCDAILKTGTAAPQ